jgi:DNA-binding winged helix-turn-helix (wHTH) protein/TolB-like protein
LVQSYRFDPFELQPAARVLLLHGAPLPVGGRAFDLLCALVERRHQVVSKTELMDLVWPGRVVEENNLTVQISALRKVLGPSAIVTVAAHGYRFACQVQVLGGPAGQADATDARATDAADLALAQAVPLGTPVLLVAMATAQQPRWLPLAFGAGVPRHGGRLMGSQGEACVAEFSSARQATACAMDLQAAARHGGLGLRIALVPRWAGAAAGGHAMPSGADLAQAIELADQAPEGSTLAAAAVRDQVTDTLDCRIEDLGDLALPGSGATLRSYRVQPSDPAQLAPEVLDASAMKPLIAIVPFEARQSAGTGLAIGELIADGLISLFGHARHAWRVVSRLSASAFRGRQDLVADVQRHLGAAYVVSGSYVEQPRRLLITLQVVDARSGEVVRVQRLDGAVGDLLSLRSELLEAMFAEIQRAVHEVELRRVYSAPLPTLQSYSLLLGGIQLLHRSTPRDFDLSFRVLGQLAQTHPHALEPRVWQAKWYAMRAVQGQSADLSSDAKAALACTGEALAIDPNNAFALAMEGFVHTHLTRDYSTARERLEGAILQNDSETFAHLFHGVVEGLSGNFASGLASYEVALSTSPQDPARYLMDSIGAYLYLGCGQPEPAIRLARESLRHNRNHAHTWRIITIGQQETGALDEARQSLQRVLELQPDLTVQRYLAAARPGDPVRHRFAEALHRAGLPLH